MLLPAVGTERKNVVSEFASAERQAEAKARAAGLPAERITSRDIPAILDVLLCCDDPSVQQHALRLVCPCRNRTYDRELWRQVFSAYRDRELCGDVRDQAGHAISTLYERARTDPRTQELLRWLDAEGVLDRPLDGIVPEWNATGRGGTNGLYIPRFERAPRSRVNRRR